MSSHAFPIGISLEAALKPEAKAARTRSQAEDLAEGLQVEVLAIDWLSVTDEQARAYMAAADSEEVAAHGHLQRYEDNEGKPILAVTWWKLVQPLKGKSKDTRKKPALEKPEAEDHTDDLYFRSGRTKPRRKRYIDPRQMDLFRGPAED